MIKDVKFSVGIIVDSEAMIENGLVLPSEVSFALAQDDESFDEARDMILENLDDEGIDEDLIDEIGDIINEVQIEVLMKNIVVDGEAHFDYSAAAALDDRSLVAFKVPCRVRTSRLLHDLLDENQIKQGFLNGGDK